MLYGDAGAYILGFFYGYLLIWTYSENQSFSPFFVVVLLWYPCFENLFSIIRKFKFKKSPVKPDDNHLHQLLYLYLKKKYKFENTLANNVGSLIILTFNFIIFILAVQNIFNSEYQIMLVTLSVIIYCAIYSKLFLYKYKLKSSLIMSLDIIFLLIFFLILFAILGYGRLFNNFVFKNKDVNAGYLGLSGIFFLIIYSYISHFIAHSLIHNSILLIFGNILFFFKVQDLKKK